MTAIFQTRLPPEMLEEKSLPGIAPCATGDWLRVDEAYAAQMAYRVELLRENREAVLWMDAAALPAAQEMLEQVLTELPTLGYQVRDTSVLCPDTRTVPLDHSDPLGTLGLLVQQDICLLEKRGDEHVLTGAVLCFPANWRLAEKAQRPLTAIHDPVPEYDSALSRRVQRLFDGVQPGRPLWRFNRLPYGEANLHQPNRQDAALPKNFIRCERQVILRLPQTGAVAFVIHTYVIRNVPAP